MSTKKIILVDDEPAVLKALERVMKAVPGGDFDVTALTDSREAAQLSASGKRFDLLITDLRMKHLDGLSLIDKVRASQPDIPVIVISAYLNEEVIEQVISRGSASYIRKPFRMAEVFDALKSAIQLED
jgi:two-component system, response regulator YesN